MIGRRWLLASLLLFLAGCSIHARDYASWREPAQSPFLTGPYILLGGAGTAYVALRAEVEEPPEIDWWVEEDREGAIASAGGEVPEAESPVAQTQRMEPYEDLWVATLQELPSGPQIAYRVRSEVGATEVHRFRVGVRKGVPFRFAAFGDTRTRHHIHRAVVERVAEEHIDFFIHTGDMVERGGRKELWERFFQIERPLLITTPILPAIGNHDWSSRNLYRRYFLHDKWAGDRRYYYHDWGNLRVVAVDVGVECRDGCAQFTFAERALTEAAREGMLTMIFLHYPPYSSGKHGSNDLVQEPISDLARRHGVEVVVAGHDHNYERTKPIDGTTYVVSGSAGAPIRPVKPRWFTAEARTEPHYVLFDVEEDRIILRAVNLEGNTFDTYNIEANPPAYESVE